MSDVALQVSFEQAASVRLRGDRFTGSRGVDVSAVNAAVGRGSVRIERLFRATEADLDAERRRLLARGRRGVPDLNRHYRIVAADTAERDRLLGALERLGVVESVIAEPRPAPPPATPDLTAEQRYRTASPIGVDSLGPGGRPGGRGDRVKIIDIEYDWNESHEDLSKAALPGTLIANGTPSDGGFGHHHGTAVLGALIGTANGFGVTGLAPDSQLRLVNAQTTAGWSLPNAVNIAHANLSAGDVMLIEQQMDGPLAGNDYVPVEYWPAVYDAIRQSTLDGIIVVEAAGNGAANLDAPAYGSPFPSGKADSGAIIVGAGTGDATCSSPGPANARRPSSTYGSRVDLQGWGQCVTTTGYGSHVASGTTADSAYTANFTGTSSAAAIVAAAAALVSSVFEAAAAGRPPTPEAVRRRLIATGTPESASSSGHIGPLPDVLAAVTNLDTTPPTVALTAGPSGSTPETTPAFRFAASEADVTYRCRFGVTAYSVCASPHSAATELGDGTWTFEVVATDAMGNAGPPATRTFTVDTVAPTVTISDGPSGPTSEPTPTFAFSSSDPGATFACRTQTLAGPDAFHACSSPYTTASLPDGARVFEVLATDAAGNVGPVASRAYTVGAASRGSSEVATEPAPVIAAPAVAGAVDPPAIGAGAQVTVSATRTGWVRLVRPRITCPQLAPCTVRATARSLAGARIGATTRTISAGASATVRFRLTKAARARLRRLGRMKATVKIEARHGGVLRTRSVRVTIKRGPRA